MKKMDLRGGHEEDGPEGMDLRGGHDGRGWTGGAGMKRMDLRSGDEGAVLRGRT